MTAEPDLLPCPWCGEKLASVSVSEGSTFRWRKVDGCCDDGPEVRHNTMADDQEAAEVESRAAAIAAWNTRANVAHANAAKDAELVELRSTIEALRAEREVICAEAVKYAEMIGHSPTADRSSYREAEPAAKVIAAEGFYGVGGWVEQPKDARDVKGLKGLRGLPIGTLLYPHPAAGVPAQPPGEPPR